MLVRLQPDLMRRLDNWIVDLDEPTLPSRPEAIRRLVEIGLGTASRMGPRSPKQVAKAEKMAGNAIDSELSGKGLSEGTKATRRGRLMTKPDKLK